MKRRAALGALAAVALAPTARAADPVKRVGYLSGGARIPENLDKRLAELGWIEGKNLAFVTRVAKPGSPPDVLVQAAAELVRADVDVLVGWTDRPDALAAATKTIPIVAGFHPDPVAFGLAENLRRPGGNFTGLAAGPREAASAWLGLLRDLRPKLSKLVVIHKTGGEARMQIVTRQWREIAASLGISMSLASATTVREVGQAFDALGNPTTAAAFLIFGGMNTVALPEEIMQPVHALAMQRKIATRGHAREGALMSYDLLFSDPMRRVAIVIDKILRGQKAAEIPFEMPDRTEFILNRATAKAIGVTITPELLLRATEVIG